MAWSEAPGRKDYYRLILYYLTPPGTEKVQVVSPGIQDFNWTGLPAGSQFAAQVVTVKGQTEAPSSTTTEWTCESHQVDLSYLSLGMYLSLSSHLPVTSSQFFSSPVLAAYVGSAIPSFWLSIS